MQKTNIGWTDYSSNPIYARDFSGKRGWFCERISPGCAHCYASTLNERYGNRLSFLPKNRKEVIFHLSEEALLEWQKPKCAGKRVFVCDMTDLFGEWVPDEWLDRIFAAMALAPDVTFQVLTKRPERMREYVKSVDAQGRILAFAGGASSDAQWAELQSRELFDAGGWWPLPNVWLGLSVENQRWADIRIPLLLDTPAAMRFISAEPLLGPLDLIDPMHQYDNQYHGGEWDWLGHTFIEDIRSRPRRDIFGHPFCKTCGNVEANPMHRGGRESYLDWIIVGGESGPRARRMKPEWAQSIVDQCKAAGVPVFVKQDSGRYPGQQGDLPDELWAVKEWPVLLGAGRDG